MYFIKRLYIFFSILALTIFFFSTEAVKAKSFEINDIEISQPFEINFDKNKVIDLAKTLKPSKRGELEITDLLKIYLNEQNLSVNLLERGSAWLDTGNIDSLHEASSYIRTLEHRQGLKIGCPEEIAWNNGWINKKQLLKLSEPLLKSGYGEYLIQLTK